MSFGDINRVNTNLQSMGAQFSLNKINSRMADNQMKLSTGLRINRAEDDAAGFSIASKLSSKIAGLGQAERNVGDAKSMLDVAESGMSTIMDALVEMKSKATQASTDSIGDSERGYIADQLASLSKEINTIVEDTSFQGTNLLGSVEGLTAASTTGSDISGTFGTDLATTSFDLNGQTVNLTNVDGLDGSTTAFNIDDAVSALQADIDAVFDGTANNGVTFTVGKDANALTITADQTTEDVNITANADSALLGLTADATTDTLVESEYTSSLEFQVGDGSSDQMNVNIQSLTVNSLFSGLGTTGNISRTDTGNGGLTFSASATADDFQSFIDSVDSAIASVASATNQIGIDQNSLSIKQENLAQSITSNSAARSRIQDADFAKVQSESIKLQIMQQTATSALAQANSSSQAVLGFLG